MHRFASRILTAIALLVLARPADQDVGPLPSREVVGGLAADEGVVACGAVLDRGPGRAGCQREAPRGEDESCQRAEAA